MLSRVSASSIQSFVRRLQGVDMHGFELRENGQIRAEGYYAPFEKGQPHRMYSISKSMVSLAIGLLVKDGKLRPDDLIVSHFPDKLPSQPDGRLMRLRIRDMLRMATCYRKTTYREGLDADWASTFFTATPTHEPGTVFHYDTSCSQVLGALTERLTGQTLLDFLNERVFLPIGADDPKRWLCDPSGVAQGGTGLIMSLRDLGKVAQLVMDGGRGLLPQDYLIQATSKQIETPFQGNPEEKYGYGWQFWRTRDGWAMYGMGGQLAIAHPQSGLLLCTIADTRLDPYGVQRIYDAFFDEIVSRLEPPAHQKPDMLSLKAMALSHMGFPAFEGSWNICSDELRRVEIKQKTVRLVWPHGEHCFVFDELGSVCQGLFDDAPCLISAAMTDERTLRLQCRLIGDAPCGMDMLFSRAGDALSIVLKRSSDPHTLGYDGVFWGTRA